MAAGEPRPIDGETARSTYAQVGTPLAGWSEREPLLRLDLASSRTASRTSEQTSCALAIGPAIVTLMGEARLHADEIETSVPLIRKLLAAQFPQWMDLPISRVESYGTDNYIYRLGDHLAVRLPAALAGPSSRWWKLTWLPRLAARLPLALPVQVAMGHPAEGYPFDWAVYEWLPGSDANGPLGDLNQAAADLAAFIAALRRVDTTGAHARIAHARGGPLAEADDMVRRSVAQLGNRVDGRAVLRSWDESLRRLRSGRARMSGCTAICCQGTCSSPTAGWRL